MIHALVSGGNLFDTLAPLLPRGRLAAPGRLRNEGHVTRESAPPPRCEPSSPAPSSVGEGGGLASTTQSPVAPSYQDQASLPPSPPPWPLACPALRRGSRDEVSERPGSGRTLAAARLNLGELRWPRSARTKGRSTIPRRRLGARNIRIPPSRTAIARAKATSSGARLSSSPRYARFQFSLKPPFKDKRKAASCGLSPMLTPGPWRAPRGALRRRRRPPAPTRKP